jgi:hypothetical protein
VLQSLDADRAKASGHAIGGLRSGHENHHERGDDYDGHE